MKKLLLLLLCLTLLGAAALPARAETVDLDQPSTLEILYFGEENQPLTGAAFSLYRVADMTAELTFTPTATYAGYPVNMNDLDSAGWRTLALTLSAFVSRDQLPPMATAAVDENGVASFGSLPSGLYLLTGQPITENGKVYSAEAAMLTLPSQDEYGDWKHTLRIIPKHEVMPTDPTSLQVVKIWDDVDAESFRPENLVIQLLADGKVHEEVLLSDFNGWRYTWVNLDSSKQWQAVEKTVPQGYTVTIDQEGTVISIHNYHEPGKPDPELPQTGLNWWPVVILSISGMMLFFIGWLKNRYHEG